MKRSLFRIPRSYFIESQIKSYAVFYYAYWNHVVDGNQDVLSFRLHQEDITSSSWPRAFKENTICHQLLKKRLNASSKEFSGLQNLLRKRATLQRTLLGSSKSSGRYNCIIFFSPKYLSHCRESSRLHTKNQYFPIISFRLLNFPQEEQYHSQTFLLSFEFVKRKVRIEKANCNRHCHK